MDKPDYTLRTRDLEKAQELLAIYMKTLPEGNERQEVIDILNKISEYLYYRPV